MRDPATVNMSRSLLWVVPLVDQGLSGAKLWLIYPQAVYHVFCKSTCGLGPVGNPMCNGAGESGPWVATPGPDRLDRVEGLLVYKQ